MTMTTLRSISIAHGSTDVNVVWAEVSFLKKKTNKRERETDRQTETETERQRLTERHRLRHTQRHTE